MLLPSNGYIQLESPLANSSTLVNFSMTWNTGLVVNLILTASGNIPSGSYYPYAINGYALTAVNDSLIPPLLGVLQILNSAGTAYNLNYQVKISHIGSAGLTATN